jgi:hypothetical protein
MGKDFDPVDWNYKNPYSKEVQSQLADKYDPVNPKSVSGNFFASPPVGEGPTMSHPAEPKPDRARPKEKTTDDEEAGTELKLGEFETVPTLSCSEARLLISAVKEKRAQSSQLMQQTE